MPLNPAAFLLCVVLSRASSNLQFTSIDFVNFFGTRQLHFLTDIFIISQCLIVSYSSILPMSLTYVHILHEIICCILPPMNLIFCIGIADEFIPWFLWYFHPKFCILYLMFLNTLYASQLLQVNTKVSDRYYICMLFVIYCYN